MSICVTGIPFTTLGDVAEINVSKIAAAIDSTVTANKRDCI
jgi:hypothetical protein